MTAEAPAATFAAPRLMSSAATLAAAALMSAGPTPAPAAPLAGAPAPAFDLPGDGGRVSLDAYRGKLVYLDFWASWCAPCKRSFPWMGELQQRYGGAGLRVVAINLDTRREEAAAFLAEVPAGFVVAYDTAGASARAYGVKGMPSSALIGRDGKLLWLHTGFREGDQPVLDAQIKAALQLQ
ncbi:TlpA family protein disulfide reductase [Pseudoduganella namucuonensis]|uniref:Thiol-disulfide isomerase or thioredoxin n=1 Tax=Pseudoduganella namucuonensis TaxID=1035707 RepID=A0A1I7I4V4_9BURK|nr:TlpA disulfide reductase family protein [Pseudoduganella namucuonensis]SFU67796.1 Thiol-disulfide isomerase or thioredoxin [Pseudoduganella namucuonensis]